MDSIIHTRKTNLPFHIPQIGEEEISSVVSTLRSGWLTTGSMVKEFERVFAEQLGCRHAIAVNSCTAALHLALEAIGLQEGDEVIVPTMTFAATAEVVTYFKARPVLVDVQADTLNMDIDKLEEAITPKTKAIIPVHFAGHPCDMDPILAMATKYGLKVIEDAAHALPAQYKGQSIGTLGDLTCFSFYATKNITTGEGGMVTTDDDQWAKRIRQMSLHGLSRDAWNRYTSQGSWYYEIASPGFKYNMTDIAAAIGIPQLEKNQTFWEIRQRYAQLYIEGFHDMPEIRMPSIVGDVQHAWHLFVIQLELDRLRIDRGEFIELLRKYQIGTSVHFIPLHHHPWYRRELNYCDLDFPVASAAYERILSLPLYPKMALSDVQYVVEVVRNIIEEYRR